MTPDQDRELNTYFHDRKRWVVEADASPPVLHRLTP
jgi:hypothetical protein